ncbi:hypothetical protein DPMN_115729 [Dreissena polymorpha]|uniref:Uncharacterized protein n=1 Tax=Dreissena polymorpha TaxID=45954 RepID=A0A9D4QT74_DREPO|nr:hypothetical protein DPMN_115729 [Dreissena polymorpha]
MGYCEAWRWGAAGGQAGGPLFTTGAAGGPTERPVGGCGIYGGGIQEGNQADICGTAAGMGHEVGDMKWYVVGGMK